MPILSNERPNRCAHRRISSSIISGGFSNVQTCGLCDTSLLFDLSLVSLILQSIINQARHQHNDAMRSACYGRLADHPRPHTSRCPVQPFRAAGLPSSRPLLVPFWPRNPRGRALSGAFSGYLCTVTRWREHDVQHCVDVDSSTGRVRVRQTTIAAAVW